LEPAEAKILPARARQPGKKTVAGKAPVEKARGADAHTGRTTAGRSPARLVSVKGQRVEIYTEMSQPLITAYVIGVKQNLAIRTWELA
jgi:hypothetical protein